MEASIRDFTIRKLTTTFVATATFSVLILFFSIRDGFEFEYNLGNQFIIWFLIYFMYIGVIILFYGNLISIIIEYCQGKWFPQNDWLYIFLVSIFGLANGLFFQQIPLALLGMLAALLYAIIDKWLFKRISTKILIFVPVASILLSWGYFQLISPPIPPFTMEDAVDFATSGKGTAIEYFPDEIDEWEGTAAGYKVKRETKAKEIGEEIYIVIFKETWVKGSEIGTWTLSYEIERGSLTARGNQGKMPPYY